MKHWSDDEWQFILIGLLLAVLYAVWEIGYIAGMWN